MISKYLIYIVIFAGIFFSGCKKKDQSVNKNKGNTSNANKLLVKPEHPQAAEEMERNENKLQVAESQEVVEKEEAMDEGR